MTNEQIDILSWMSTGKQPCPPIPTLGDFKLREFRHSLIKEELTEYLIAPDLVELADSLADMLVVLLGTACAHGIDLEPVYQEVMRSNWTKFVQLKDGTMECVKNHHGKILKPANFSPPVLAPIIQHQTDNPL